MGEILNPRQRRYCILRASGMTGVKAYIKAGYKESRSIPAQLERKDKIKQEIKRLQDKMEEKLFNLQSECQKYSPEVVQSLVEQVRKNKKTSAVRLGAAKEILDRGFGKAREHVEIEDKFQLIVIYPKGKLTSKVDISNNPAELDEPETV